jgi:hypothetical protein
MIHYAGSQLAFNYPAQWSRYEYSVVAHYSSLIVYLSSDRLHDPCTRTSIVCTQPIERLGAGGVLIKWWAGSFPGWTLADYSGTSTTIASRPAKVLTEPAGNCFGLAARVTVSAYIERAVPANYYGMLACANGPNVGAIERQVMTMLATVRLIQP